MINFDAATHEYSKQGVVYDSVTTILKKYGLSADYANIPDTVLAKAAARGSAIHQGLENYINGQGNPLGLDEVNLFDTYIQTRAIDLSKAKSETMYYNDQFKVAGTVDIQYEDNGNVIADFKTTSSLHIDAVSWQLSIYNYLICAGDVVRYYFNQLKVIHLRDGKMRVRDVATISYDEVEALLTANVNGDPTYTYVKPNNIVVPSQEKVLVQLTNEIEQYKENLKQLESERDKILDTIKDNFVNNNEYSYNGQEVTIKYVSPQHRTSWDNKKVQSFLESMGQDITQYKKETITKDGVKVTLVKP